jgi:hypothetical protein
MICMPTPATALGVASDNSPKPLPMPGWVSIKAAV